MSELRQDLISGDWVLMAPGRAARPKFLEKKKQPRKPSPKATCPFEDLQKSGNWPPVLSWPNDKKWEVAVVQNKYPALTHQSGCAIDFQHGPYSLKTAAGEHDVVITKDHFKNFADLKPAQALRVLQVLQEIHKRAAKDKCNVYISSFANWGPGVGASIYHPHYQVLTLPIIPPHIVRSLGAEERYFRKYGKCARCTMIQNDRKERTRIVEENRHAIAVTPFASKEPFEVRILPKKHLPYFGKTPLAELKEVSSLLQSVLRKIKKNLHDPDFNFFIHGAPFDRGRYEYHHWHIEVIPKISLFGGFELSTGIDINVVDPETAAKILRGA